MIHRHAYLSAPLLPLLLLLGGCAAASAAGEAAAPSLVPAVAAAPEHDGAAVTVVGHPRGSLLLAGGGRLGPEVIARFVELAGGADARIVVIPGAGTQEDFPEDWSGFRLLEKAGAQNLVVLHTRDREVADSPGFAAPLREATGVWIPGGRQWRLTEVYLGTATQRELFALLDRGGVIGGTSAGASVQASFMVRGSPTGNHIVVAPGYEEGFGFLRNVAVDQHLLARNREEDLVGVVERFPNLLGIGLDEGTALVVRGDTAEVIGRSVVAIYDVRGNGPGPYFFLQAGDVFDLARREVLQRAAEDR